MQAPSAPQGFIPHEVATIPQPARQSGRGLADLFGLVSFVLVAASIALAVGIFLYLEFLTASANSKADQLQRAKAAFEPSLIAEFTRLDDRMHAASEILQNHIAPSVVFTMLEQTTIASVGYTSFSFDVTDSETISMQMDGVAGSVNGIALQADLFSRGGMLSSPIFSNINRELDGVHFSLSANVHPLAINFSQLVLEPRSATLPQAIPQVGVPAQEPVGGEGAPPPEDTSL